MNMVVLDGGTTNPGDLSWGPLEQLGNLTVYDETPAHLVKERLKGAQAVILNRIVLGREEFSSLPELRYVGTLATGYNTIDTHAAGEFDITVCNVPHYCEYSVAQHALSLLLCLCGKVRSYPFGAMEYSRKRKPPLFAPGRTGRKEAGDFRLRKHR